MFTQGEKPLRYAGKEQKILYRVKKSRGSPPSRTIDKGQRRGPYDIERQPSAGNSSTASGEFPHASRRRKKVLTQSFKRAARRTAEERSPRCTRKKGKGAIYGDGEALAALVDEEKEEPLLIPKNGGLSSFLNGGRNVSYPHGEKGGGLLSIDQ